MSRMTNSPSNRGSTPVYSQAMWTLNNYSTANSSRRTPLLPLDMTFTEVNLVSVISYSALFVIAASGNLTVFLTLCRSRQHIKSRINLFIMHLAVADLVVTFVMMPLETAWHISVSWQAGDAACRILMFMRAFGLYLSSYILVTITMDRFFAIMKPMSLNSANKRGRIMLGLAWGCAGVSSLPQSIIFHVEKHPIHTWFEQCNTFNFFPSVAHELAYNIFNIIAIYILPLVIIIISYTIILYEITRKAQENKESIKNFGHARRMWARNTRLRPSSVAKLERARIKTLKLTIFMVLVFVVCWTPYFVLSAWWWFHQESAKMIDPKIQQGLFVFAVSNSCMNPIVYGMFTINFRREWGRCCRQRRANSPRKYYYSQPMSANMRVGSLNGLVLSRHSPNCSKVSGSERSACSQSTSGGNGDGAAILDRTVRRGGGRGGGGREGAGTAAVLTDILR